MELNSELAEELIHRGFETSDLDYKIEFDNSTQAWMEIVKDICGFANYGGGFIVIGVEDGAFKPVGLDDTFHVDTQDWLDKVSKWVTGKIDLSYIEHVMEVKGRRRKFPILHVNGSIGSLAIPKVDGIFTTKNGENKTVFKLGVVYTRKGTSTVPVSGEEFWQLFWSLLKRTAEKSGSTGTPLEVLSALSKKAEPDTVEETLWFNLFPVTELPDMIYSAETECRYAIDVYNHITNVLGPDERRDLIIPPFFLEDKKIYTFSYILFYQIVLIPSL
jgi:hypothetical protein